MSEAISYLEEALAILDRDFDRLELIDRYLKGNHRPPYMPDSATAEYKLLAERSVTNWCELIVKTPVQALYVDNFRRSDEKSIDAEVSPEWRAWQESRMDARQGAVYYAAGGFGYSFVLNEKKSDGKVLYKGLSPRRTVALYEDPATDLDPVATVYIKRWPTDLKRGVALIWDEQIKWTYEFDNGELNPKLVDYEDHGASECPVTPFFAYRDLEGRAWGVVEPIIQVQDRFNQTVFDLLVAQTYSSFEVRTVSGMAPPVKMRMNANGDYEPMLDEVGNPIPDVQQLNASRFLYAEDSETKFNTLPGGDLSGFINSAEQAMRHISAISQTPPHFMLGQIANISADALKAAELALSRKVEELRSSFGESWERVFRIALQMQDESLNAEDYLGEVVWRDTGVSSLAQSADALGKFAENLGIPKRGLWPRVPNVSRQELREWGELLEEDNEAQQILTNALGPLNPTNTRTTSFGSEAVNSGDGAAA